MEVASRERDVKYHEALFEILSKQYENAKVDEAYSPPVELVDPAVFPDEKSWPPKKWFAIGGLFLGGLFGICRIVVREMRLRERLRRFLLEADSTDHRSRVSG
jgi:tyrosine-protein kinase Etk/Wzc